MQQVFLIALGGVFGAVARYGVSTLVYHLTSETFPWGTLVINLTGSLLIGAFVALFDAAIIPSEWRSFVTIGFLGAYTTFSTYTLETVNLLRDGEVALATVNVVGSNIVGLLCVVLGMYVCKVILQMFS